MKNLLLTSIFAVAAIFMFSGTANAQWTTYSPTWNPGPDVTQMTIEKNMMRDRMRHQRSRTGRRTAAPNRRAKKRVVRRATTRRRAALDNFMMLPQRKSVGHIRLQNIVA